MVSFRDLHVPGDPLLMANPWDAASVHFLVVAGARAIATSSAGFANVIGRADSTLTRTEAIEHGRHLALLTDLPVNGDLEDAELTGQRGNRLGIQRPPGFVDAKRHGPALSGR